MCIPRANAPRSARSFDAHRKVVTGLDPVSAIWRLDARAAGRLRSTLHPRQSTPVPREFTGWCQKASVVALARSLRLVWRETRERGDHGGRRRRSTFIGSVRALWHGSAAGAAQPGPRRRTRSTLRRRPSTLERVTGRCARCTAPHRRRDDRSLSARRSCCAPLRTGNLEAALDAPRSGRIAGGG